MSVDDFLKEFNAQATTVAEEFNTRRFKAWGPKILLRRFHRYKRMKYSLKEIKLRDRERTYYWDAKNNTFRKKEL